MLSHEIRHYLSPYFFCIDSFNHFKPHVQNRFPLISSNEHTSKIRFLKLNRNKFIILAYSMKLSLMIFAKSSSMGPRTLVKLGLQLGKIFSSRITAYIIFKKHYVISSILYSLVIWLRITKTILVSCS